MPTKAMSTRQRLRRRRLKRTLAAGLGLIFVFLAVFCGYSLANSSLFDLQEIRIEGNQTVSRDELLALSGLRIGTNTLKLSRQRVASQIRTQPYIKDVVVRWNLPNKVSITVTERSPMVLVSYGGRQLILDEAGVCLTEASPEERETWSKSPPIRCSPQGIQLTPAEQTQDEGILAAIALIKQLDPYFMENILEISAASAWELYVINIDGLPVYFGPPDDLAQKLQNYEDLLIKNREECNADTLEYVDLRYDTQPIIKRK